MKLSQALRHGITLRPESHQERFCNVENRGLCSDAWGAAVEAEYSAVAFWNWNPKDRLDFFKCMEQFRLLQQHYFGEYFKMPVRCPLASQRFIQAGGRIINRKGDVKIDGAKETNIGGVTSECDLVEQMAGMVDHLFYGHGWSREEVLEVVEWYENQRATGQIQISLNRIQDFQHYGVN